MGPRTLPLRVGDVRALCDRSAVHVVRSTGANLALSAYSDKIGGSVNQLPEMSFEERMEQAITELRSDWRRDLDIIFSCLRVIGTALDVREKLEKLIEQAERASMPGE